MPRVRFYRVPDGFLLIIPRFGTDVNCKLEESLRDGRLAVPPYPSSVEYHTKQEPSRPLIVPVCGCTLTEPMTKDRTLRREHLRCLARVVSQCGLNEAQALACGRTTEAAAWGDLKEALQAAASRVAKNGLARQLALDVLSGRA